MEESQNNIMGLTADRAKKLQDDFLLKQKEDFLYKILDNINTNAKNGYNYALSNLIYTNHFIREELESRGFIVDVENKKVTW